MKRYIVLENGKIFEGEAFGADGKAIGETVFSTGVVGFTETLTDPSYYGQIVVQTFPTIGNYGIMYDDMRRGHARSYENDPRIGRNERCRDGRSSERRFQEAFRVPYRERGASGHGE